MVSTVKLSELWQRMGYRVVVACMGHKEGQEGKGGKESVERVSETLTIYRKKDFFLPDPWNYGIAFGFFGLVRRIIREEKPDLIIINKLLFWTSLSAIPLTIGGRRPIVLTDTFVGITWWPRGLMPRIGAAIYAWTLGWIILLCAKRVVLFHPQSESLLRKLCIAHKTEVIPTGIDATAFFPSRSSSLLGSTSIPQPLPPPSFAKASEGREEEGAHRQQISQPQTQTSPLSSAVRGHEGPSCPERGEGDRGRGWNSKERNEGRGGHLTVTYVGRLESVKGVADFLAAAVSVLRDFPQVRVQVVGWFKQDHPLVAQYRDRVIFTGLRHDIPEILASTDIFVLPSYSEGLSNALMEAMASGCACIASDVGGNRFLIQNGVSGFLFPAGDHEALRAHMRRLLTDPAKLRSLGGAARKRIEDLFDWKKVGEQYRTLFNACS